MNCQWSSDFKGSLRSTLSVNCQSDVKQQYVKQIQYSLLHDSQTLVQLIKDYKKQHPDLAKRMSRAMSQAVCKIAAKKVLNKALQLRKENVGYLLKNIRLIKCLDIKENEDFGVGVHSAASEPYYFDASYRLVKNRLSNTC